MHARLGDSQLAVLEDMAFFRFLTCKQLARLRHPKSKSYAQEKMRELARDGYLRRSPLDRPRTNPTTKTEHIYALDVKGVHALRRHGWAAHTEPQREYSYLFLRHTLGVNDVFIAAMRLEVEEVLRIEKAMHEQDIKEQPLFVESEGRKLAVTPDGYLQLSYGGQPHHVFLEYDRGTEQDAAVWKDKIRRMVLLGKQRLAVQYPGQLVTMATAVVPRDNTGERRVQTLLRWTYAELERLGRLDLVDVFYFSARDPWAEPEDTEASARWWREPHWQVPGRPERFALLEQL